MQSPPRDGERQRVNLFLLPNGPGSETDRETQPPARVALSLGAEVVQTAVSLVAASVNRFNHRLRSLSGDHGPDLVLFWGRYIGRRVRLCPFSHTVQLWV